MLTLSKNLTFSLAIVTMLVLGFAFAPVVMAHTLETETDPPHTHSGPVPTPELSLIDVSAAPGNQLEAYAAHSLTIADAAAIDTQAEIDTLLAAATQTGGIMFHIRLREGVAALLTTGLGADTLETAVADDLLHIHDIDVVFYDINGIPTSATTEPVVFTDAGTTLVHHNTRFPDGRNFMVTIAEADVPNTARFASITLPANSFKHADIADVIEATSKGASTNVNVAAKFDGNKDGDIADADDPTTLWLQLVNAEPTEGDPEVVSIIRVVDVASRADQGAQAAFGAAAVTGPFMVKVTFTEEPNLAMKDGRIDIAKLPFNLENAKITNIVKGTPHYLDPPFSEGNYADAAGVPDTTGRDARYHPYLLTIEPALTNANDVVIRVTSFEDLVIPSNRYTPPNNLASAINRSVLRVSVHPGYVVKSADAVTSDATKANRDNLRGNEVFVPGESVVPSGGYLVLVRGANQDASGVRNVGAGKYKDNDNRERADNLTDIDFKYNVKYGVGFRGAGDNLELFFRNGGTITLRYKDAPDSTIAKSKTTGYHGSRKAADEGVADGTLVISEIMWGTDGMADKLDAQWIELHNPGATDVSIDREEWVLRFDGPTPVRGSHFGTVVDTVGNNPTTGYWEVPGSNGRAASAIASASTLTSMFLTIDGATVPADGTAAANWMASPPRPVINLLGNRVGTPGAATPYEMPVVVAEEPVTPPTPPVMISVAGAADIAISEIMYSTGRGSNANLPQWIELHNMSAGEVSLEGWQVEIENEGADDLTITLGKVTADADQAVLLVSKNGRNSGMGDEEGDLRRVVNLKDLGVTGTLLSSMGFTITLSPPPAAGSSVRMDGDAVGGMDWDLPMMDGDRSSLIREKNADETYKDGTMRMSWHPTSSTGRYGTYYGNPSDMGTPGYVKGGPLPVELSMFYPARDRLTGQVVIRWETQSELNNAGFFVKRSEARKGPFTVINPTMIAGAGTTSEKQSYTYTDASAKPNVLYFYQIEDVSLDGKRATLTNAHRLRGHIGAAGKATTIWGELKSQE